MQLTISYVQPNVREWEGKYGKNFSVKVAFTDGTMGEVNSKSREDAETLQKHFAGLVGKASEFQADEPRPVGDSQVRPLKNWPGKPQGQGGQGRGGGGGYATAWRNSEEGARFEAERSDKRTAIMQSVAWCSHLTGDISTEDVLACAERIYRWLREGVSDAPKQPERVNTPAAAQNAPPRPTAPQNGHSEPIPPPAPDHEEKKANHRGRFFALWHKEGLPEDHEYQRFVVQEILKQYRDDIPKTWHLRTMTKLTEDGWALCADHLEDYMTSLGKQGWKPTEEPEYKRAEVAA